MHGNTQNSCNTSSSNQLKFETDYTFPHNETAVSFVMIQLKWILFVFLFSVCEHTLL